MVGRVYDMDGSICRSKGCCLCCTDTGMELTRGDIQRLKAAGHVDFSTDDGRVVNRDGRCIFLSTDGRCRVYAIRPEGCRSYPLVMMLPERKPVLDKDCPHRNLFKPTAEDMIALEDIMRHLEEGR